MSPVIQFMGTHQTRFDIKGRISIPAPFRTELRNKASGASMALVLRSSHKYSCIEGWPAESFQALAPSVATMEWFSDDQEDLTMALYADACAMEPDKEGRIVLPDSLVQHAGLTDSVLFIGMGRMFQVWEPVAGLQRLAQARQGSAARRLTVPPVKEPAA